MTPDPQLADSLGNWIGFALIAAGAVWKRSQQNDVFAKKIDTSLAETVAALSAEVKELKESKELDQARTAIQTEKINHLDQTMTAMGTRFDRIEEALPRVEDVLHKTLNFFERQKATKLEEQPIAGSGGLVAIKEKKEK